MTGPVFIGSTTLPRHWRMASTMRWAAIQKNDSWPKVGRSSGIRPGTRYAPGGHMK